MAPPYVTSPKKVHQSTIEEILRSPHKARRRQGPAAASTVEKPRSLKLVPAQGGRIQKRLQEKNREATTIHMFRNNRDTQEMARSPEIEVGSDEDGPRRRTSYTREQKLAAVSYALTKMIPDGNGGEKLISKYKAA